MSELPFLNKKKPGMSGVIVNNVSNESDDGAALLDMVADEFLSAIEKKDKALLVDALRALVFHIQDEDQKQDEQP